MKVARGRSWQPEIGMEHASRGRRSGNKGVGARWRGRFRIFSARHRSRTKVSHAENSGMTTVFFLWGLLRCRGEILSHPRERQHEGFLVLWGALLPFILRACCGSMCWPVDRPGTHAAAGAAARGIREGSCACVQADVAGVGVGRGSGSTRRFLVWGILSHALERSFGAVTPLERRDPALRRGRRGINALWTGNPYSQ